MRFHPMSSHPRLSIDTHRFIANGFDVRERISAIAVLDCLRRRTVRAERSESAKVGDRRRQFLR